MGAKPIVCDNLSLSRQTGKYMRISIPGLGGRLRRARNGTGLSQLCELYDKPIRWFLTLEEGDLEQENGPSGGASGQVSETSGTYGRGSGSDAAGRVYRKIADAPAGYLPLLEKVVEDILDGLQATKR